MAPAGWLCKSICETVNAPEDHCIIDECSYCVPITNGISAQTAEPRREEESALPHCSYGNVWGCCPAPASCFRTCPLKAGKSMSGQSLPHLSLWATVVSRGSCWPMLRHAVWVKHKLALLSHCDCGKWKESCFSVFSPTWLVITHWEKLTT